jgi:hypothetical protein
MLLDPGRRTLPAARRAAGKSMNVIKSDRL